MYEVFLTDIVSTGVLMTNLAEDLAGLGHLGIPGLAGYLALLTTFAVTAWRAMKWPHRSFTFSSSWMIWPLVAHNLR